MLAGLGVFLSEMVSFLSHLGFASLFQFDTRLSLLWNKKANMCALVIIQRFLMIQMIWAMLIEHVALVNLVLILFQMR